MMPTLRRVLAGWDVLTMFALLVVPVVVGAYETTWMTPLALPGYLLLTVGSAIGNRLFPWLALWTYWIPFVVGSYGVAVIVGAGYRAIR